MTILTDSFIAAVAVSNGQIVRASGNDAATLAQADSAANAGGTLAVVSTSQSIAAGSRFNGVLAGGPATVLLETGLTPVAGQTLYLSATVAGRATNVAPGGAAVLQIVGVVQSAARYASTGTVTAVVLTIPGISALVPGGASVAAWSLSLCRYFLVDNENGLDSNIGYVDAVAGSTIDPTNKAIKTIDRLYDILPRVGAGRSCVVLLKGRTSGTYVDADGVNASLLLRGFTGYNRLVVRGSTDLTNVAADRLTCGGRTATGFSAGGYNVTPTVLTIATVTNATPVAITTTGSHGLATGDQVTIASVGGQPSANGEYTVTVTGATTFTLNNTRVIVTEAYTSGGTVTVYRCTLAGGGAPAFPALNASLGYRLRFDAATATAALRNTCYEIFALGNDTIIPGRFFTTAPSASDVLYIEEAGAQFTAVEYQGEEAFSLSGVGSTSHIIIQGTDGIPTISSFSVGACIASFYQATTSMLMFGPMAQAVTANFFYDETNTTVTNGGGRAREHSYRGIGLMTRLRCMSFGTTSPDIMTNCTFSAWYSNYSFRGFDVVRCNSGAGTIPAASFSFVGIGKGTTSTARRNRLGGSAHNGSINLVQSAVSLYGNFFDGATANLIFIVGVGVSVAIDDCIGLGTTDVPGINVGDNGRMCNISIGVNAPNSAAGSAGKQVQAAYTVQVTYSTLAATNPVTDGQQNRLQGVARFTSLVIV